jgi:hypothetical protein
MAFAASVAGGSDDSRGPKLEEYRRASAVALPPSTRETLNRVEGVPRQVLALRSYLRAGEEVARRWSWSEEQIRAFADTSEYRQLLAEVREIKDRFETANPGYTLYANTEVRSLDVQLERWNRNASVEAVATAIERAALKELASGAYPAQPDAKSSQRFAKFLRDWHPPHAAPLAAPGLSKHGQLRAVDFAIFKDGRLVARADILSAQRVWDKQGWSEKLKQATLNTKFEGPLLTPYEPWHYEYKPAKKVQVAQECTPAAANASC